jgi:hypothetical protein
MIRNQEIVAQCRAMLAKGASTEKVLDLLRSSGFSKVHYMKALVNLGQASMADAKVNVHHSSAWTDVRERDAKFRDGLEKA